MWLSAPMTVGPLMTTCGSMRVPRADLDVGADDGVGADVDVASIFAAGIDDRSRVDQDLGPSAMRICASATSLPSTSATPMKRHRFRRRFTSSTRKHELIAGPHRFA